MTKCDGLADSLGKAGAFRSGEDEGDGFACDKTVLLVAYFCEPA